MTHIYIYIVQFCMDKLIFLGLLTFCNNLSFYLNHLINFFCNKVFIAVSYMYHIQVNLDITDSMGPGKLVRHMQNLSYTYDEYLICIGLGPSISSVICKNPSYSGPSYPSSPLYYLYDPKLYSSYQIA